jgi:two-component system phosphate regulon sensor histidine kinase PhoR
MRPKKLIWQLYVSYLLIMGIPVVIVTWYAARSYKAFFMTQTVEDLKARAYLIGSQVADHIEHASVVNIDSLCKTLSRKVSTRFTVISPTGKVLGDSERDPDSMENHANRSEVIAALSGGTGVSGRFSHTLLEDMIYVAMPVYHHGSVAAVVRTAISAGSVKAALGRLYRRIGFSVVFMALVAALVSLLVSRKISRPIGDMKLGAQRFAAGDFSVRLPVSGFDETDSLAGALNEMANRLSATINTITAQRNELDAILSSMIEGVIALDAEERIITINRAAADLFGINQAQATGKWIGEALRNVEVQDFLKKTLAAQGTIEGEAVLSVQAAAGENQNQERFLQLHGTSLRDVSGAGIGGLMVVNDITRIKKLENIRRDFVANVSHELRTPLTSIKGYVETLITGAMNNREDAARFLGIVAGQVDRLNTIVEDLLSLSRLEREDKAAIEKKEGYVSDVLTAAIAACRQQALSKGIDISLVCDGRLAAAFDQPLLEQAVINLLDNAIKYSDEKKRVWVEAGMTPQKAEVVISVKDEGIGIEPQHQERLFERFYRVDKARSRKLGGTGLGLSIVKHIALAHGGRVAVESAPGKGSVFYLSIPA